MRTVSLDEICDIQIGKTPSRSNPDYWYGNLPWVTISDMSTFRFVCETKEKISEKGAKESGSKMIMKGTLLLSFKLSLGKRAFAACDLYTNEAIAALKIKSIDQVEPHYLYWALGNVDYFLFVDRAAKGKTLNKAKLKKIEIPLPPLSEQKRIAKILDASDALRSKRRESLALLDDLTQSIFLDMFGDPVTNPMGWKQEKLGMLCTMKSGGTPSRKNAAFFKGTIPWVTTTALGKRYVGYGDANELITEESISQSATKIVPKGSMLIGVRVGVGKVSITESEICTNQDIMSLHGYDTFMINDFLRFQIIAFNDILSSQKRGATIKGINSKTLKDLPVIIPPLYLQQRFAAIVESIEKQKERLKAQLSQMDTLFSSLQQRAFNGEL